jgi:hypothetical protein
MTFLIRAGAPYYREQLRARAMEGWWAAERLVTERWRAYLAADRSTRRGAFAAYAFALEAEAAAAGVLAETYVRDAA